MLRRLGRVCAGIAAALLGLATSASADRSTRPLMDWSGFYAGAVVGYGWSPVTYYDPAIPTWSLSHDPVGFVGGVRGGYNHQTGRIVTGLEGEFLLSGISGGVSDTQPGFINDRFEADVKWIALATARLGYACGPILLFARGGVAWALSELRFQYAQTPGFGPTQMTLTRTGWTLGGGSEYAFGGNWSATATYSYVDFGRSGNETFQPLPDGFVAQVAQAIHLVTVGLNYRFRP